MGGERRKNLKPRWLGILRLHLRMKILRLVHTYRNALIMPQPSPGLPHITKKFRAECSCFAYTLRNAIVAGCFSYRVLHSCPGEAIQCAKQRGQKLDFWLGVLPFCSQPLPA